jgi:hypothetical protein
VFDFDFLICRNRVKVKHIVRQSVSRPVSPGVRPPSGTRDQPVFPLRFIIFRQWLVSYYESPSLTRGRPCNLLVELLLGIGSAVNIESESHRTRDHNLLSHMRPPNLEGKVPVLYPPGAGWTRCTPGNLVPFSSSLTIRRATEEVTKFLFTRDSLQQTGQSQMRQ